MIHRLQQEFLRNEPREVSCYHNSTEVITVRVYRLECQMCEYRENPFDGHASNSYIRDREIDHNLEVLAL